MKNFTHFLRPLIFSFSTLGMVSSLELLNLSPTLAQVTTKTYTGNENVTIRCVTVNGQSTGNYSIDGRPSGTRTTTVEGVAYFDNDPASAQIILDVDLSGRTIFNGSGYDYGFQAFNFGAAITATGVTPDGTVVLELPDVPDPQFGFTVDCPVPDPSSQAKTPHFNHRLRVQLKPAFQANSLQAKVIVPRVMRK